jgi:hypothetical protein
VPDEGYVRSQANDDHRLIPFAVLKSGLARRFSGLGLIKKDLDLVKQALRLLQDGVDNKIVKQSLAFFAVVTYAKTFAQAEGRGLKIDVNAIKDMPGAVREEHQRLIEQHNQYVAHGGEAGWEQNAVAVSLNIYTGEIGDIYPNIVFLKDIDSQLENFWLLVAFVEGYVLGQLKLTFPKLKQETLETGFDGLMANAIMPKPDELQQFS